MAGSPNVAAKEAATFAFREATDMETSDTKHVVSVSLGSAKRNKTVQADILG